MLVKWQEGGLEAATWEDISTIQNQFPKFNLEDKIVKAVAGNVRKRSNERG